MEIQRSVIILLLYRPLGGSKGAGAGEVLELRFAQFESPLQLREGDRITELLFCT